MKTKKVIDEKINLLLNLKSLYNNSNKPNYCRIIGDCIKVIKRGEKLKVENKELKKYKAIWEEFNHYPHITIRNVHELINELKQKHFPEKEKNEESRINRTKIKES